MTGPETGRSEIFEKISFEKLWLSHPFILEGEKGMHPCRAPHQLIVEGKKIDAGRPTYGNQCAIRLGVALMRSGIIFSNNSKVTTCGVHAPSEMHTIRTEELATNLEKNLFRGLRAPIKMRGDSVSDFFKKIPTPPGIIYIKNYWTPSGQRYPTGDHIDLWNGYRTTAKPLINSVMKAGMTPNYARAQEVWFFEIES